MIKTEGTVDFTADVAATGSFLPPWEKSQPMCSLHVPLELFRLCSGCFLPVEDSICLIAYHSLKQLLSACRGERMPVLPSVSHQHRVKVPSVCQSFS